MFTVYQWQFSLRVSSTVLTSQSAYFFFIPLRVQEIDGSYFESFTSLAWKQQNLRQKILKDTEASISASPPSQNELGIASIDYSLPQNDKDKLYIEMLYTIANSVWFDLFIYLFIYFWILYLKVGAPALGGQYKHYKDDLYFYGQKAFGVPADKHYKLLHLAGEEKPPIVVLNVVVIEAEGLEAKDANGYAPLT